MHLRGGLVQARSKTADGQGLHHEVAPPVLLIDKPQYGLVDGARHALLEERVVGIYKVAIVLVREHFEDGRGYVGHTCFGIIAVVEFAARPRDAPLAREFACHSSQNQSCQVERGFAGNASGIIGGGVARHGGADAQCAVDAIVRANACV